MRTFSDGDEIVLEPWRASGFPIIKDLVVDRSAFDRIIEAGGYVTVDTGSAPDANLIPIPKETADLAMDAAACIGCGACVAACPNGAAQLFTSAKMAQLNLLPQGQAERYQRAESHGRGHGGALRLLHQHGRVRGGLPQGHLDRLHRDDEQGLPQGEVPQPPHRLRPAACRPTAVARDVSARTSHYLVLRGVAPGVRRGDA
jgi:ferredoxin